MLSRQVRLTALLAMATGLVWIACQAADEPKTNTFDTKTILEVSGQLKELRKQVDEVNSAYAAYTKATDSDQRQRLWEVYTQTNDALVPRILEAVRHAPNSSTTFELLEWIVTNGRISAKSLRPYGPQAVEVLRNQYTTYPDLGRVCRTLAFGGDLSDQPTREFLQIASTKNPNRTARGFATFALARLTKESAEGRAFFEAVPPSIYTNAYANVAAAEAAYERESKAGSSQTVFRQAEQLFETVAKKYADCPNFESGPGLRQPKPTLGDQAVVELYECRHLTPGKVAPEIEGEDLNGLLIRLSDYRGKVVVLSFWASWCGPCMQMMPHERAMAQRLESKSFAFVGVNGDALQADAKRAVTKSDITWPSFWNGKEGPWSGIAADWNVKGWPTVFVLDSRGTIRLKLAGYGGQRTDSLLDEFVDRLLKETGDKHG